MYTYKHDVSFTAHCSFQSHTHTHARQWRETIYTQVSKHDRNGVIIFFKTPRGRRFIIFEYNILSLPIILNRIVVVYDRCGLMMVYTITAAAICYWTIIRFVIYNINWIDSFSPAKTIYIYILYVYSIIVLNFISGDTCRGVTQQPPPPPPPSCPSTVGPTLPNITIIIIYFMLHFSLELWSKKYV